MTRKYSAVIFDLDGTLMDTLADLCASTNYALAEMGFPVRTIGEVRSFVGNGVRKLLERAAPAPLPSAQLEQLLNLFRTHYASHCNDHSAPYNGILDVLEKLDGLGIKMAIVSNKPDAEVKTLSKVYFSNFIEVALGENEAAGIPKKPAPEMVFKAMVLLGVNPSECVYVGDSDVDIQTARNAGVDCLSVTWGFKPKQFLLEQGATCCISRPDEIIPFVI